MENQEITPAIKQKVKSKIYDRYNWGSLAVCFQIGIATVISTALQLGVFILMVSKDQSLLKGGMASVTSSTAEYAMVFTAVAYIVANTVSAAIALKVSKTGRIRDYITKPSISALDIVLACIAILGISSVDSLIMDGINSIFDDSSEALGMLLGGGMFSDNLAIKLISIAYIAVLGPVTEEILLRGCVLPLSSHISPRFAVFCSALLFGLMHGNVTQIFNAFMLGLLLAYVTLKSRSIIPAMLMHIANNSISVIFSFITNGMDTAAANRFDLISNAVVAVIGIVPLILLIRRLGKVDESRDILKITPPVPQEYIDKVVTPDNPMTMKTFFTTWALWLVIGFAVFMSFVMIVLGQSLGG